jgi:hypothetical protein
MAADYPGFPDRLPDGGPVDAVKTGQDWPRLAMCLRGLVMLISYRRNFVFIANLKSASTSIEAMLHPFADVKNTNTATGKHDGFALVQERYGWLFERRPIDTFFVFGVIRDPVEYALSVYNSHTKDAFDGTKHSAKGIPFDKYWMAERNKSWQLVPQVSRFKDSSGKLALDYVIDFSKLKVEFEEILTTMNVENDLRHLNESPVAATRNDVPAEILADMERHFAEDYAVLADRPRNLEKCTRSPGNKRALKRDEMAKLRGKG